MMDDNNEVFCRQAGLSASLEQLNLYPRDNPLHPYTISNYFSKWKPLISPTETRMHIQKPTETKDVRCNYF